MTSEVFHTAREIDASGAAGRHAAMYRKSGATIGLRTLKRFKPDTEPAPLCGRAGPSASAHQAGDSTIGADPLESRLLRKPLALGKRAGIFGSLMLGALITGPAAYTTPAPNRSIALSEFKHFSVKAQRM